MTIATSAISRLAVRRMTNHTDDHEPTHLRQLAVQHIHGGGNVSACDDPVCSWSGNGFIAHVGPTKNRQSPPLHINIGFVFSRGTATSDLHQYLGQVFQQVHMGDMIVSIFLNLYLFH